MNYVYKYVQTPVGKLKLIASDQGLAAILWENDKPSRVKVSAVEINDSHPVLVKVEKQLQEYFAGERKSFALELDFVGTDFQKKVWRALLTIPYGETRSYGELAIQVGNKNASRAVGAANGRNPISIVVPCHRVIGSSGALTGFAGGVETKAHLLDHESEARRSERPTRGGHR